ncbi:hypothetical protein PILCRDRAFT_822588 [Piloderma croceum F 1598]|uniref:Peptidase A1 domain-containing protein n=1 Tax=Piloderma croceum (strain F 1598) TaxID=765440 RepID=A0A0C3F732_PILCF|nr:hypothetical protein PILCRDRAFT_822588 [Piloderma croceum F 1598]
MKFILYLLALYAAVVDLADALHLPMVGRSSSGRSRKTLGRRTTMFAGDLTDVTNVEYFVNITLGGEPFTAQIDTGSSDLWVAADSVPNATTTGKTVKVQYAVGEADGPILLADLEFAEYKVSNQAFFLVEPDSNHPVSQGIIGLGPGSVSAIRDTLNSDSGDTAVDRIFNQNHSSSNFISVLLGRSDDPDNPWPGDITVGTVMEGYEEILNQPKLDVATAKNGNQHWSVVIDPDGIIGPNGEAVPVQTTVSSTKNSTQLTGFFDTGFTLPQVPANVAQFIYSQIEGATLVNDSSIGPIWTMGCDKEVNISIKAGGQNYPMHPLDTTMSYSNLGISGDGCVGTFQPIGASAVGPDFDMIIGMAMMRNFYTLINYGDFVVGTTSKAAPYAQLLSTSNNTAQVHQEFVQARLNGVDTTGSQTLLTPDTSGTPTPSSTSNNSSSNTKKILIYAAIGVGGLAALLLLGSLISCMCRRGSKGHSSYASAAAAGGGGGGGGARGLLPSPWERSGGRYQPLHDPAPAAATEMYAAPYASGSQESTAYHPPSSYPLHSWQH